MRRRWLHLSQEQRQELKWTRDHHPKPYIRIKAGAILKVDEGHTIREVAANGLHRRYSEETVRRWINAYLQEGLEGLKVKQGRGRKPVFSPCP